MENKRQLVIEKIGHITHSFSKEDLEKYGKDWTSFYPINPLVIFFPKNTLEVQQIILFANENKIPIVPSGGRTGLSGGAVASNLEIVVSLEKMNKIYSFNAFNQSVVVEAGVITQELQNFATQNGLFYPVDFGSRGSSQIGGNIATNAGGIKVLKYGLTRNFISGVTFVTAKGDVLEVNNGLIKNATGYDLRHLIIGSEGTLGIVTEAIVQLAKTPKKLTVLFLAINKVVPILNILQEVKSKLDITAFEFLSKNALNYYLKENSEANHPFNSSSNFYVLIEFENQSEKNITIAENLVSFFYEKKWIENDLIGQDPAEINKIWQYRERITDAIAKFTPYKNDVSVLPSDVPLFIEKAERILLREYPGIEILWFGHIADGNIHINILKPNNISIDEFYQMGNKISPILFKLIKEFNGSISAEHGIGLLKKDFIGYSKSNIEIEYQKAIKKVFDPNNIMNPGKLIG
ncbi:MAG: FAD-binding oxidoreductase [Solirubrobacteraceae bacterium]